jgi:hypothetical protein
MKNFAKNFGIIAMAAIISFTMTACGDDGDSGGPGHLGDTLELSGQVYLIDWIYFAFGMYTPIIQEYTGSDLTINDRGLGGSGEIKNGNLSYSIGTPAYLNTSGLRFLFQELEGIYDDIQASTTNVKSYVLGGEGSFISKFDIKSNWHNNSMSETAEWVFYVYVEDDVTISGKGKTETGTDNWYGYTYNMISKNISLALKTGWNAVYLKRETSGTFTGTFNNPTSVAFTDIITVSLGDPSLKWVLHI